MFCLLHIIGNLLLTVINIINLRVYILRISDSPTKITTTTACFFFFLDERLMYNLRDLSSIKPLC